ncbi:short-chain dehydrogenase [Bacterioplanes sanyensis]|uniref:Short-chain dehydrogenase n=1 Tax=Bacterioplanes sanyensis TaxID=1249553 RepID=A0A222FLL6_9GAMM|nr:SDR family NAD(P)-dependent oxidoreductase [Bacterioplanes sanyensis]ASP39414.1 short-chain dehydrogenase [Bacterioplanes sanyensis]
MDDTKIALITGCSSGIGKALMQEFLHNHIKVYAGVRNVHSLQDSEHQVLTPIALDVTKEDDIARCAEEISRRHGKLDYLINNAGFAAMGPLMELSTEQLERQFHTNVYAPVRLTQALLPSLKAANNAKVINIGSVSGILTTPFSGAYCASKAALHSVSDALRLELAPWNIRVITVQPGAIESSFGDNSLASLDGLIDDESEYAAFKPQIEARATASQQNPTSTTAFARQLTAQLLSQPSDVIRLGSGSWILPWMQRWLPTPIRDGILGKKFGLK